MRSLAVVVFVLGAVARIKIWLADRGLWHDELYVGVNLIKHSYPGMAAGLYWNQTAPPGWLVLMKFIYQVLGPSEYVLRLPALLASLAALALVLVIARQSIGPWAALLAGLFVAINPMLLYYSSELKQYTLESAMALLVILAATTWSTHLRNSTATRNNTIVYAIATLAAIGISYSALIVLAGTTFGISVLFATQRLWRQIRTLLLISAPALVLGAAQAAVGATRGRLPDQDAYFAAGFPPRDSSLVDKLTWLPHMWSSFVTTPLGWQWPLAVVLLALLGLYAMWSRGKHLYAAAFAGVYATAIAAASVHGVPLAERVALYLVAPICLLIASAIQFPADLLRRSRRKHDLGEGADGAAREDTGAGRDAVLPRVLAAAGAAVLGLVAAQAFRPAIAHSAEDLSSPRIVAPYQNTRGDATLDNGRALMREVKARLKPGDVVLGYWYTEPLILWYGTQYHIPVAGYTSISAAPDCHPAGLPAILTEAKAKRVFYIHMEPLSYYPADFHTRVLADLSQLGTQTDVHNYGSTLDSPSWTLFELTSGSTPFKPTPGDGCISYDPERK